MFKEKSENTTYEIKNIMAVKTQINQYLIKCNKENVELSTNQNTSLIKSNLKIPLHLTNKSTLIENKS
jgi:hypothetical protein